MISFYGYREGPIREDIYGLVGSCVTKSSRRNIGDEAIARLKIPVRPSGTGFVTVTVTGPRRHDVTAVNAASATRAAAPNDCRRD